MLFLKGGVFQSDATGLVTQKALTILRNVGVVKYWSGNGSSRREIAATIPTPDLDGVLIDEATREDASRIYSAFKSYFDVNFPMHELTNCFSCLNLEATLTWAQRRGLLNAMADHESLSSDECWLLVCINSNSIYEHTLTLFFRSTHTAPDLFVNRN